MGRFKRTLVIGILMPIAFVGSCTALIPPAMRLADPLSHSPIDAGHAGPFPILVVRNDEPRVLMLENVHVVPALADGETYTVPPGKDAAFERYLNDRAPHGRDRAWVLSVERLAAGRQR